MTSALDDTPRTVVPEDICLVSQVLCVTGIRKRVTQDLSAKVMQSVRMLQMWGNCSQPWTQTEFLVIY